MQLSYNKLKTFNECALRYRYAYVERLPRPPIPVLAAHRRIHSALAAYHALAKIGQAVETRPLLEAYDRLWDTRSPSLRLTREYREGMQILLRYRDLESARGSAPAFLERRLKASFGPYVLTGVVDRVDFTHSGGDDATIIDYKLDRALPNFDHGSDADPDSPARQLLLYAILVRESLGLTIGETRLLYLRHGVERVIAPTPVALRSTVNWLDTTAAAIQRERAWKPCVGAQCRTCQFIKLCPAHTHVDRPAKPVWTQPTLELHSPPSSETAPMELPLTPAAPVNSRQPSFDFS